MTATGAALIRTYVPLALAVLFGWLASLGIEVDAETKALLVSAIGALIAAVYYSAIKLLEKKFPWLTVLLGSSLQPVAYAPAPLPSEPVETVVADDAPGRHEAP